MNKTKSIFMGALLLVSSALGTSCRKAEKFNEFSMQNAELKAILMKQGFTFNEAGALVQDDKVKNCTSLDLSGTKLADFGGLEVFPNLTEVLLRNNDYKVTFDFAKLPASVTSVDLTGNELYEFDGLLDVKTAENGDETVTVLRKLTKLRLPEGAKYDCNVLPLYLAQKTGADIRMADATGKLAPYNTLREVPDEAVRAILKNNYPSMFSGDKIDIAKRMVKLSEKQMNLAITTFYIPKECTKKTLDNPEGVQYIIMNKSYNGAEVAITTNKASTIPYLKIEKKITSIVLGRVSTPYLNLSEAEQLVRVQMGKNHGIETLDLSHSKKFAQRPYDVEFETFAHESSLNLSKCDNLKKIILPEAVKRCGRISIVQLPKLERLDLSNFNLIGILDLAELPVCKISYLDYKEKPKQDRNCTFGISQDIYEKAETKTFLDKYHKLLKQGGIASLLYYPNDPSDPPIYKLIKRNYKWKKHYPEK